MVLADFAHAWCFTTSTTQMMKPLVQSHEQIFERVPMQ